MSTCLSGMNEFRSWIATAMNQGAERFELWEKPFGVEKRFCFARSGDMTEVVEAFMQHVLQDDSAARGFTSYAVIAYKSGQDLEFMHAVLQPELADARAPMVLSSSDAYLAPMQGMQAMAGMAAGMQKMSMSLVSSAFTYLQKENEQQRRMNEHLLRANQGQFEPFVKGYERSFSDLHNRLESSITQANELQGKVRELEEKNVRLQRKNDELAKQDRQAVHEIEEKRRVTETAIGMLKTYAPAFFGHLVGDKGNKATLVAFRVKQFFDSLDASQYEGLLRILKQDQIVMLADIKRHIDNVQADSSKQQASETPGQHAQQGGKVDSTAASPSHTTSRILAEDLIVGLFASFTPEQFQQVISVLSSTPNEPAELAAERQAVWKAVFGMYGPGGTRPEPRVRQEALVRLFSLFDGSQLEDLNKVLQDEQVAMFATAYIKYGEHFATQFHCSPDQVSAPPTNDTSG